MNDPVTMDKPIVVNPNRAVDHCFLLPSVLVQSDPYGRTAVRINDVVVDIRVIYAARFTPVMKSGADIDLRFVRIHFERASRDFKPFGRLNAKSAPRMIKLRVSDCDRRSVLFVDDKVTLLQ